MPYCSQCGVEVDDRVEKCPLCQTPIQRILPEGSTYGPYPEKTAGSPPVPPLNMREKMAIARTIMTMGILIPLLFVMAIDYFINRQISWSAYVSVSLAGAWLIALISLFSWRHPYILNGLIHADVMAVLFILGRLGGESPWFLPVGLPIVVASGLFTSLSLNRIGRMKEKGANVAAVILLIIASLCVVVDLSLGLYLKGDMRLGWSLVVLSVMLPTALLLFYVQSPRFSHSKLRRFLHF